MPSKTLWRTSTHTSSARYSARNVRVGTRMGKRRVELLDCGRGVVYMPFGLLKILDGRIMIMCIAMIDRIDLDIWEMGGPRWRDMVGILLFTWKRLIIHLFRTLGNQLLF